MSQILVNDNAGNEEKAPPSFLTLPREIRNRIIDCMMASTPPSEGNRGRLLSRPCVLWEAPPTPSLRDYLRVQTLSYLRETRPKFETSSLELGEFGTHRAKLYFEKTIPKTVLQVCRQLRTETLQELLHHDCLQKCQSSPSENALYLTKSKKYGPAQPILAHVKICEIVVDPCYLLFPENKKEQENGCIKFVQDLVQMMAAAREVTIVILLPTASDLSRRWYPDALHHSKGAEVMRLLRHRPQTFNRKGIQVLHKVFCRTLSTNGIIWYRTEIMKADGTIEIEQSTFELLRKSDTHFQAIAEAAAAAAAAATRLL